MLFDEAPAGKLLGLTTRRFILYTQIGCDAFEDWRHTAGRGRGVACLTRE